MPTNHLHCIQRVICCLSIALLIPVGWGVFVTSALAEPNAKTVASPRQTVTADTAPGLHAGVAAVDISPTVTPFQLRSGKSRYVHDPLHVRAIALQHMAIGGGDRKAQPANSIEGRVAIAIIDAIGYGRERCDQAKALVAKATGWDPAHILVAATHTHSAPKGGDTSPGRIAYEKQRFDGIVKALTQAIQSLEPARIGFGSAQLADEVRNRRWFLKPGAMDPNPFGALDQVRTNGPRDKLLKPAGPIDPQLCVIDIRTRRNRPLGLLANYALHYVGGIPKKRETDDRGVTREVGMASADYFGEFARLMPYRLGAAGGNQSGAVVAMMSNGASGDINNLPFQQSRPPREPFEQVRLVASKAADAAWHAVKKIETYHEKPVIAVRQREVTLTYRMPSQAMVERAKSILELPAKDRAKLHRRASGYANAVMRHHALQGDDRTEKVIVQAIRIGDQAIVTMPFEVLVEIGLDIKKRSPFPRTFLIELANGSYGYLPPPHQFEFGGYETWLGTARFEEDSSVILTKHLLEMLVELEALR